MSKKSYEVSIITPYHNVEPDYFKVCVDSMKKQTYGFENIQWVIVLHNCTEESKAYVTDCLSMYENVVLYVLDNEVHSASSPRNKGLTLATGDYIGFLDADDSFNPDCIEVAAAAMKRNQAQVVVFRREYEIEKAGLHVLTEIVLWNQTMEEIVMDREHLDDYRLMSGIWGTVTSKMYEDKFLKEHKLIFDEQIKMAEDFLFNIECYARMDKIVVLPQHIGYKYYINSNSTVQTASKTGETMVNFAMGFDTMFRKGLSYGLYMTATISQMLQCLARNIKDNPRVTLEQRIFIRDKMMPYLDMVDDLKPSKIYSELDVKLRREFPREIISHPEKYDCSHNDTDEEKLQAADREFTKLQEILSHNCDTDYGKRYEFSSILSYEDFRSKLPIADYAAYEKMIMLGMKIGENDIYAHDQIETYILDMDSDENSMVYPVTSDTIHSIYKKAAGQLQPDDVFLSLSESSHLYKRFNDGATVSSLSGLVLLKNAYDGHAQTYAMESALPLELNIPRSAQDYRYEKVLFALYHQKITLMSVDRCWEFLELMTLIKEYGETLCTDIEHGEISGSMSKLPEEIRSSLKKYLIPNKERADELRGILAGGFHAVMKKIWPSIKTCFYREDGESEIYLDAIRDFAGEVSFVPNDYFAANSLVGVSDPGRAMFRLSEDTDDFYEFMDVLNQNQIYDRLSVQIGKMYEVLVTSISGLYRFRTGDLIRIEEISDEGIYFKAFGRRENYDVIADDCVLYAKLVYDAFRDVMKEHQLDIQDFSYSYEEGRLLLYLEPTSQSEAKCGEAVWSCIESEILQELLKLEREEGYPATKLAGVKCYVTQVATHSLCMDIIRSKNEIAPGVIRAIHKLGVNNRMSNIIRTMSKPV